MMGNIKELATMVFKAMVGRFTVSGVPSDHYHWATTDYPVTCASDSIARRNRYFHPMCKRCVHYIKPEWKRTNTDEGQVWEKVDPNTCFLGVGFNPDLRYDNDICCPSKRGKQGWISDILSSGVILDLRSHDMWDREISRFSFFEEGDPDEVQDEDGNEVEFDDEGNVIETNSKGEAAVDIYGNLISPAANPSHNAGFGKRLHHWLPASRDGMWGKPGKDGCDNFVNGWIFKRPTKYPFKVRLANILTALAVNPELVNYHTLRVLYHNLESKCSNLDTERKEIIIKAGVHMWVNKPAYKKLVGIFVAHGVMNHMEFKEVPATKEEVEGLYTKKPKTRAPEFTTKNWIKEILVARLKGEFVSESQLKVINGAYFDVKTKCPKLTPVLFVEYALRGYVQDDELDKMLKAYESR